MKNKIKILLIQPPLVGSALIVVPNIGLASIAAVLKENNIDVSILDAAAEGLNLDDIIAHIKLVQPDIVGAGGQTPVSVYSIQIFKRVKREICKQIYTLAGGPHFSFTDIESLEQCPELDLIVRKEAEHTILDICMRLQGSETLDDVTGITYRDAQGNVIRNPDRNQIDDIDSLPYPAWELFPFDKYHMTGIKTLSVTTSRGCAYHCPHCISWKIHNGVRLRSPKRIVDEMIYVAEQFNIKTFYFQDDQTFYSRQQLEGFLDELEKREIALYWLFETRADVLYSYKDLWKRMKENGLYSIFIGLESPNSYVKDYYNKGGLENNLVEEMLYCFEHTLDIIVNIFLVIGAPFETEQDIIQTANYAKYLYPKYCSLAITTLLIPYPGTELFKKLDHENKITTFDWAHFGSYDGTPVIKSHIAPQTMKQLFLSAWKNTFSRPRAIRKIVLELFSWNMFRRTRARHFLKIALRFIFNNKFVFAEDHRKLQTALQ